jgi:hypothetical protein
VTWANRCPDEYAAAFCEVNTQMSSDLPVGEIDYQPIVYDEARLRAHDQRTASSFERLIAAAKQPQEGSFAGYSQVFLPRSEEYAIQDDTLVVPDHRGHRLGTTLKLATLEILLRDHPDRASIHTWTDPESLADVPHQHRSWLPGGRPDARDAEAGRLRPSTAVRRRLGDGDTRRHASDEPAESLAPAVRQPQ